MSIRKTKEGRYLVETYAAGRRTRLSATTLKGAKTLEQEARSLRVVAARGLEEALAQHLSGGAKALKDYRNVIISAHALQPFIKDKTLADAGQVADDIKRAFTGHVTNSTINRKLALLRHVCHLAFDWGWTDVPVGKRVKLLPENPSRQVYLSVAQVEELARQCPRSGAIVLLAVFTGLRQGEILGLERGNVQGNTIALDSHTKSGRPRTIPVPAVAVSLLDLIPFACTYGVLRGEFEAARLNIGMPGLRFHDLRHSYASVLADQGIGLSVIGELLGHSSPTVTKRYAHLAPSHLRSAVDRAFTATPTATGSDVGS